MSKTYEQLMTERDARKRRSGEKPQSLTPEDEKVMDRVMKRLSEKATTPVRSILPQLTKSDWE